MHATPSCLVVMNVLFVKSLWGHSVGGQLFPPLPENDRKVGQIVTACIVALVQLFSSHETPTALSHWVNAHGATSALFLLLAAGGRGEEEVVGWGKKLLHVYLRPSVTEVYMCIKPGGWQHVPLPHPLFGQRQMIS